MPVRARGEAGLVIAGGAVVGHDWHTPQALTRQAPVGGLVDHARDAIATPLGDPGDLLDLLKRSGAHGLGLAFWRTWASIHGGEPLWRRAKDDGLLAAPADRIFVDKHRGVNQGAAGLEVFDDDRVGLAVL